MSSSDAPLTATESVHAALLMQWCKGAWETSDAVSIEEHFHPDCVVTGMGPEVLEGVAEVRGAYNAIRGLLKRRSANVSSLLVRGEQFACTIELQGRHCDTEIDVAFEVSALGYMRDGLIHRCHHVVDRTGLFAKLGVLDIQKYQEVFG